MKKNYRKSSNIVDTREKSGSAKHEADMKSLENPRLRLNEPVAWNQDKSEGEVYLSHVANPGKLGGQYPKAMLNSPGARRGMKEPSPKKLSKNKENYGNIPDFKFFKHTTKGK